MQPIVLNILQEQNVSRSGAEVADPMVRLTAAILPVAAMSSAPLEAGLFSTSCIPDCDSIMELGPPPDSILTIPPPPIPSFLRDPVEFLVSTNGSCDLCGWARGDDVHLVQVTPRQYPAIDDMWYFIIISAAVATLLLAVLLIIAAFRCKEAKVKPVHDPCSKSKATSNGSVDVVATTPGLPLEPVYGANTAGGASVLGTLSSQKIMWSGICSPDGKGSLYALHHHPVFNSTSVGISGGIPVMALLRPSSAQPYYYPHGHNYPLPNPELVNVVDHYEHIDYGSVGHTYASFPEESIKENPYAVIGGDMTSSSGNATEEPSPASPVVGQRNTRSLSRPCPGRIRNNLLDNGPPHVKMTPSPCQITVTSVTSTLPDGSFENTAYVNDTDTSSSSLSDNFSVSMEFCKVAPDGAIVTPKLRSAKGNTCVKNLQNLSEMYGQDIGKLQPQHYQQYSQCPADKGNNFSPVHTRSRPRLGLSGKGLGGDPATNASKGFLRQGNNSVPNSGHVAPCSQATSAVV